MRHLRGLKTAMAIAGTGSGLQIITQHAGGKFMLAWYRLMKQYVGQTDLSLLCIRDCVKRQAYVSLALVSHFVFLL